jgi:hypothetical protein
MPRGSPAFAALLNSSALGGDLRLQKAVAHYHGGREGACLEELLSLLDSASEGDFCQTDVNTLSATCMVLAERVWKPL